MRLPDLLPPVLSLGNYAQYKVGDHCIHWLSVTPGYVPCECERVGEQWLVSRVKKQARYDNDCSICMEGLMTGSVELGSCHHSYHKDCLEDWTSRGHDCCPLCLQKIDGCCDMEVDIDWWRVQPVSQCFL